MENENVLLLSHFQYVKCYPFYNHPYYTGQTQHDLNDYSVIDVTSQAPRVQKFRMETMPALTSTFRNHYDAHPNFERELSPFFVGPVTVPGPNGPVEAEIFEIFWQCAKVYPCHNDNGRPNADYFHWRDEFYARTNCEHNTMRHACKALGCDHSACLYAAYYDVSVGDYVNLDYVQARKKLYFPEYAKLIYNTDAFRWLKSLVDNGERIALLDFDGFNYYEDCGLLTKYREYTRSCEKKHVTPALSEADCLQIRDMKSAVNNPTLKVGHGFVIKALLQGDLEVVNGEVVDHAGILE